MPNYRKIQLKLYDKRKTFTLIGCYSGSSIANDGVKVIYITV